MSLRTQYIMTVRHSSLNKMSPWVLQPQMPHTGKRLLRKVLTVSMVKMVPKAQLVLKVHRVFKVSKVKQGLLVLQVPLVLQVRKALKVLRVLLVLQALPQRTNGQAIAYDSRTLMAHGVHTQTFVVQLVLQVRKVLQVPKVRKVTLVQLVRQDHRVFRVQ